MYWVYIIIRMFLLLQGANIFSQGAKNIYAREKNKWKFWIRGLDKVRNTAEIYKNPYISTVFKRRMEKEMATTPVFLPGESQGQRSLMGCRLWGHRVRHNWSDLAAKEWEIISGLSDEELFCGGGDRIWIRFWRNCKGS